MNIGIVALLILVAVIAIGFFRKLNVGVLAMAAAVILGYVSGDYTTKEIVAGYSSSLFITLFGLTLLFGIITTNGCLEQVMRRLINVFGKMVWDGACHSVFVSMVCFGFGRRLCRPGIYMRHYDSRYPCHWL